MTGYELSRNWFDWAFENPDLNSPTHTATYMWIIDKWNRSGQVKKLVLPSSESMAAIGVKSYNTYIKVLQDLISYGFIEMVQKSKNQYTANIIAISEFNKALDKALDKAMIKHATKQSESTIQSTGESICSIYKQSNKVTIEQSNNVIEQISDEILNARILELEKENLLLKEKKEKEKSSAKKEKEAPPSEAEFMEYAKGVIENELKQPFENYEFVVFSKYETWISDGWKDGNKKPITNWKSKFKNTLPYLKPLSNGGNNNTAKTIGINATGINPNGFTNINGKEGKSTNRLVELGKRPSISELRQQYQIKVS